MQEHLKKAKEIILCLRRILLEDFFTEAKDFWHNNEKKCIIALRLFVFSIILIAFYGFFLAPNTNGEGSPYNLHRNLAILFFGIFGGGLAIWARFNHEKQLKHTEKQIEFSFISSRNDRFAKAADMLGGSESLTSHRGGLQILQGLIEENPETEYIRCAEIIAYWMRGKDNSVNLGQIAVDIFFGPRLEKALLPKIRESIIKKHKEKTGLLVWPDFDSANFKFITLEYVSLQSAFLLQADFQHAKLAGAKFKGAVLGSANMKNAIGLTKEQILQATFKMADIDLGPPELPDYLLIDPDIQEWLNNPPFLYEYDIGER